MEIIQTNAALLSNFEVIRHLQMIKSSNKKQRGQLATITYETLRYLENSPSKNQNSEAIEKCLRELSIYCLTKQEKLMLINTPPASPLELQVILEGSGEKITETQVLEILEIIKNCFPIEFKADEEN